MQHYRAKTDQKRDLQGPVPKQISERRIMSAFKQKNAIASAEFKKFKGIDTTAPHRETSAACDMVNFRVLPDGSLQKRCGFEAIASFTQTVRSVWSGKLNGQTLTFVVYGNTISKVDMTQRKITIVGKIGTSSGYANFIFFNGYLYLSDQKSFYLVTENSISSTDGYAPLYGKEWGIGVKGTVNEPLNLASKYIRMTYLVDKEFIYLCVDHLISSINAVYVNGVLLTDKSKYYFDPENMCVCVMGLKIGDRVSLFLTVDESELNRTALLSCADSVVYGDTKQSTLFLWNGEMEGVMFASSPVDEDSLKESTSVFPSTTPLYIPSDPAFKLPRSDRRITAVCRQYDRLLIFTEQDTWMARLSSDSQRYLDAITVNPSYGCTSPGAVVMCGNDPVCVSDGTVLRWNSDTDEFNECNAYSISSKIKSMLPDSFFSKAVVLIDKERSEILFSDPSDTNETLWIYNYATEDWYKFDGIGARMMFLNDKNVGFVYANSICMFNEELTHDKLKTGNIRYITAFYESHPTDLEIASNKKRLCGMTLNANFMGQNMTAEYHSDEQDTKSITIGSESNSPVSIIRRLHSERFCYTKLRLVSDADVPQRIYSTSIWAKP